MARIVEFRAYHLGLIEPQAEQMFCAPLLDQTGGAALLEIGPAWSCVDSETVFGSAGFWDKGDHAQAWAILSARAGSHMLMIHKAVIRAFKASKWQRIETFVRDGFAAGERWAVSLGFIQMQRRHLKGPDGNHYGLWMFHG